MKNLIALLAFVFVTITVRAQKDPIERVWYNAEKTSKIEIYRATDGKLYGKIVWLKEPTDANGKPRTDVNNPKENLRNTPIMNYPILKAFTKSKSENEYEGGSVYDPMTGKTYCGKLTLQGTSLKLRGYICGFSLLGRSSIWTAAD
ncbi:MAG: DUF2147 domain-containing protein [Filimonas sp.]|nr:DUF2147 domain-containing protein [Filimonas sp.]